VLDDLINTVIIFLTGLGSGIFVSIASGTAFVIIVPIFILIAGLSLYQVIGTNLVIDCIIGGVAGLVFLYRKRVRFKPIIYLGSTGVISAVIGTRFSRLPSESLLTILIGILLIILGLNFVINGVRKNIDFIQKRVKFSLLIKYEKTTLILLGVIIGFISGIIGIGSAGIIAIILVLVYSYDLHTGIGTSLVAMFFIAGAGAVGQTINNNIAADPLIYAGFGALIGSAIGAFFSNKVNEDRLGRIIGIIITILGVIMIYKLFYL
jgi:hypothetical protein